MSSPAISENLFLLYSLLMGIFITFVYDLFRVWRRVCTHNAFFISVEDILFWIFCAVSVFYLMHTQSNGTLRWFAILGALTGMFFYKKTLSSFFVNLMSGILKTILKFFGKIFKVIAKPFRFLAGKGKKIGRKMANGGRRTKGFLKKKLTACKKLLKIILCKQ